MRETTRKLKWHVLCIIMAGLAAIACSQSTKTSEGVESASESPAKADLTLKIPMVLVEGGTFQMGCTSEQGRDCDDDEKPAHQVTVGSFEIGKTEVTQAQWKAVMGDNPSDRVGDDLPVENVSWDDIQKFVDKLNAMTGKTCRLPTEAEWEYAARGGRQSKGYKYSGSNDIDEVAWYEENAGGSTHPVGTKKANELGIHDMSGNVWEWTDSNCNDDDSVPARHIFLVFRGGSWDGVAGRARVSARGCGDALAAHSDHLGFRLACSSE